MARIFITGSTDGLGLAAARALIASGHDVVLHARSSTRASALADVGPHSGIAIGDLASEVETRSIADQLNRMGRMNAVIHNAGVYLEPSRAATRDGHSKTLAVNTLAPYMLTALMDRPDRLIYLSSGMHRYGGGSVDDMDWVERRWEPSRAYAESKLYLVAIAFTVARHWPTVLSNAVDPGWVPTRMGGAGAPDNLQLGHLTQTWLATSDDSEARVSGEYWHHRSPRVPAAEARDPGFQDQVIAKLKELTGVSIW